MSNGLFISDSIQVNPPARQQAHSGYQASREGGKNVRITEPMDDPEFKIAVARLNKNLSSGRPLRHDAPRGYYLNVRI